MIGSWLDGTALLVSAAVGVAVAAALRLLVRPAPRLAVRVRPYTVVSRTSLGRGGDALAVADAGAALSTGTIRRLLDPIVHRLATGLSTAIDRTSEEGLRLKLRHAGMFTELPAGQRVHAYRVRQLASAGLTTAAFAGAALLLGVSAGVAILSALLGFVVGATRWRGRVERAISDRREQVRIELYTVNQLLAMTVRVGGGVVQAIQRVVERGSGAVVSELAEVLRLHRGGRRLSDALEQAARTTVEPNAARTYKLLANGVELGADLAEGLRALSEDVRAQRVEAIKRAATRRRAAMLVPIIAVLAPVMLLFIAAPLPSLILGGR